MNLLLTGSTGFLGRNLLLQALRRYDRIVVPVRSLEKLRAQFLGDGFDAIPTKVVPIVASVRDWALPLDIHFDHVVHCAGTLNERTRDQYFEVNVEGVRRLLSSVSDSAKVILISSQAASGPCVGSQMCRTESDTDHPLTFYGESKLEMEKMVKGEFPSKNVLCLRPPMVLGARDSATLPLFKMVRNPVHFKPGFRPKYYSFIAVDDLVRAVFSALESEVDWRTLPSTTFFIAASETISDHDLISSSAQVSGKWGVMLKVPQGFLKLVSRVVDSVPRWREGLPTLSADRAKELWPDRWVVSSENFQKHFKWIPQENLHKTLQATHDWYRKTGQLRA